MSFKKNDVYAALPYLLLMVKKNKINELTMNIISKKIRDHISPFHSKKV